VLFTLLLFKLPLLPLKIQALFTLYLWANQRFVPVSDDIMMLLSPGCHSRRDACRKWQE